MRRNRDFAPNGDRVQVYAMFSRRPPPGPVWDDAKPRARTGKPLASAVCHSALLLSRSGPSPAAARRFPYRVRVRAFSAYSRVSGKRSQTLNFFRRKHNIMANQKPVDEIRIGRVKATSLAQRNRRPAQVQRHLLDGSTKTAINGRVRRASGATICWCLRKWPIKPIRASSRFRRKKSRKPRPSRSGHPRQRAAEPFASPLSLFSLPNASP